MPIRNPLQSAAGQTGGIPATHDGAGNLDRFTKEAIRSWRIDEHAVMHSNLATDGTDVSAQFQADIDALWVMCGGKGGVYVLKDGATYTVQDIIIRPGVTIRGENVFGTFTEGSSEWSGPRVKLPTVASKPLFRNDTANGYVRATTSSGPNANQKYAKITLAGLMLSGSRSVDNHTTDCDLLHLESCWGVTLRNLQIIDSRGFGIKALDCNTLDIDSVFGCNAPWYFDSLADSVIRFCQNGGSNGLCSNVVWLTNTSHKNELIGNFFYNSNTNGFVGLVSRQYVFRMTVGTVSAANDTIQFSGNDVNTESTHRWLDEVPVTLKLGAGATAPGGITAGKMYYTKRIDSTTVKLATSLRNLRDGVFVDITSAGSGTMYVSSGDSANLALTDGSKNNEIVGGRYDQSFGCGVLLDDARNNILTGFTVHESAFGNYTGQTLGGAAPCIAPTPGAAVVLRNNSTHNVLSASSIDGAKQGTLNSTTGYESRQKFGLSIDASSSVRTVVDRSFMCVNHSAAASEAGAANYAQSWSDPNRFFYGVSFFKAHAGTPVVGSIDNNGRHPGWLMDAASDEVISAEVMLPPGVTKFRIGVIFANAGAGAGNVAFNFNLDWFNVDESLDVSPMASAATDLVVTAGARAIRKLAQFDAVSVPNSAGLELYIRIKRVGTSASDTLANDVGVIGVVVEQVD